MADRLRVSDVMHALFSECSGVIEFRAFDPKVQGCAARLFAPLKDLDAIRMFWSDNQGRNLFWGVATRRDDRDGGLANCMDLPALFADLDFKLSSEAEVRGRLGDCPLQPSIVVASGGGLQPYWLLKEPEDVQADGAELRELLRRLAAFLAGDIVAGEPARVLRVPGTLNRKYDPPRLVRIEQFVPSRVYDSSEFDWLPAVPVQRAAQPVDLSKVINELRNHTLYRLARALKGKKMPDIVIVSTVRNVNAECCAPPLEDWEVRQILHNALTQPDRPMPATRIIEVA